MRHIFALGIKYIIVSVVILSIFGVFYGATLFSLLLKSLVVTVVGYVIGDLFLLKKFGNVIASLADFVLHFVTVWLVAGIYLETANPLIIASLAVSYFITVIEPLFHAYMIERVFQEEEEPILHTYQYETEIAEEQHPDVEQTKNVSKNKQTDMNVHD